MVYLSDAAEIYAANALSDAAKKMEDYAKTCGELIAAGKQSDATITHLGHQEDAHYAGAEQLKSLAKEVRRGAFSLKQDM